MKSEQNTIVATVLRVMVFCAWSLGHVSAQQLPAPTDDPLGPELSLRVDQAIAMMEESLGHIQYDYDHPQWETLIYFRQAAKEKEIGALKEDQALRLLAAAEDFAAIMNTTLERATSKRAWLKRIIEEIKLKPEERQELMDAGFKEQFEREDDEEGAMEGAEEDVARCNWLDEMIAQFDPSDVDEKVNGNDPLFKEVRENYSTYFAGSRSQSIPVTNQSGWTIRKASHSNKGGTYLIEKVILKLFTSNTPSITLHEQGVVLGTYEIEGRKYEVATFSWRETTTPEKVEVSRLCELAGHEKVYAIAKDTYVQIHFLKDKDMELSIQINSGGEEVAETWMRYLSVLVESAEEKAATQSQWESRLIDDDAESDEVTYDYFVSDKDAWQRESESPYGTISPTADYPIFPQGTQVAVLEVVKDGKSKDIAKMKVKISGETGYTTLTNLTKVEKLSKELKYKMKADFEALTLPYGWEKADRKYEKDAQFTAYKRCGDYLKVKGAGDDDLEGHWISREKAIATEPEFPISTEKLEEVFDTDEENLKELVKLVNKYSNEFGITSEERMAHFLAQIGHETGDFEALEESCNYSKTNGQLKKFSRYYTSNRKHIALSKGSEDKTILKQMQNADLLDEFNQESIWYFNDDRSKVYKIVDDKSEKEYTYGTEYDSGDGIKTKYVGNKVPDCPLFDYVYCCGKANLGNGDAASKDGSRFRGRGYIHLTGRYNYDRDFYRPWKKAFPNDKRTLSELVDLLRSDKDLAMRAAMVYWEGQGLNQIADNTKDKSDDAISDQVTRTINSGMAGKIERRTKYKLLKSKL